MLTNKIENSSDSNLAIVNKPAEVPTVSTPRPSKIPKALIVIFLLFFLLSAGLGTYYFFSTRALKESVSFGEGDSVSPTAIILSDYENLIQAHFLEVKGNDIYFINRLGNNEERLTLKNPVLYVCRSPLDSGWIYIEVTDPGYFSFIEPEILNNELFRNDPIAIAVNKKADRKFVGIFVVSDKCSN